MRREWKAAYKARGMKYPRIPTIGFVELDVITVPEWAWAKRIKGLTDTRKNIWLRRILARELMREDEAAGGTPKVTWTSTRRCRICRRVLLGVDAENRFLLDLKMCGEWTTCSPECVEIEASRIESQQQLKRQGNRKGK